MMTCKLSRESWQPRPTSLNAYFQRSPGRMTRRTSPPGSRRNLATCPLLLVTYSDEFHDRLRPRYGCTGDANAHGAGQFGEPKGPRPHDEAARGMAAV